MRSLSACLLALFIFAAPPSLAQKDITDCAQGRADQVRGVGGSGGSDRDQGPPLKKNEPRSPVEVETF